MLEHCVKRGTLLTVIVLIVCVLGIVASLRIPVQMIPDLEVRKIRVTTSWAGATPRDIEAEILFEQERYLRTVPDLIGMESSATAGRASISLEFPHGVDINQAMIRVSNALSRVSNYPENVTKPRVFASSFSSNAFMYYSLSPRKGNPLELDMDLVRDFVEDEVRSRMERVTGVSEISIWGGGNRQIQIRIDPTRLAQRGITLTQVRSAIRQRNRDRSAGDLESGKRRYLLRVIGRFADFEALEELIISRRAGTNIRLKDVASVHLDHFKRSYATVMNGEPRITLAVRRESGSNVIQIKKDLTRVTQQIKKEILDPAGLELHLVSDDVRYVQDSIYSVWFNLAVGAILATLIMFLYLRSAGATLVSVIGIPICTIAAFIGLMMFGRTINVISLAGVAFAIGMTVDNSIVVLERIERLRREGMEAYQAAVTGVKDVWTAVFAATSTTVLVFLPILFVEEEAGQLFSDIAIALGASISVSMLVAVAVVPAASARFKFAGFDGGGFQASRFNLWILAQVARITKTPIRRGLVIILTITLTLGGAWYFKPAAEYLPEGEEPKAFTWMFVPPGYNLSELKKIGGHVESYLIKAKDEATKKADAATAGIPPLKYYFISISHRRVMVITEPRDKHTIQPMMDALVKLFRSYPGMTAFSSRGSIISSNSGGSRAVNLDVSGPDLGTLYSVARALKDEARKVFGNAMIRSTPSSLTLDQPMIEIRPRWERLAEHGFGADDFAFSVASLSDGAYVDDLIVAEDKIAMYLFGPNNASRSLDDLSHTPMATPSGHVVPLSALADITQTTDSPDLRRINGRRTVTVRVVPPRDLALETAVERARDILIPALRNKGLIKPSVSVQITGAADQLSATYKSLIDNALIALILIYLLLVAIFSHWAYPLFILATVPLGIAGSLLGLVALNGGGTIFAWLGLPTFQQPFDMITMLGFLILLGTVVNNPILIVDQTRRYLETCSISVVQAVNDAVASRLRPILMSTATTLVGLAPLVLIPGAGTELYRGLGVIVLTGLAFSTLITLFFLPCILVAVLSRVDWVKKRC